MRLKNHSQSRPALRGVMIGQGHGIICWGETAKACYDNTIDLISRAAAYLNQRLGLGPAFGGSAVAARSADERRKIAASHSCRACEG